jgi:protein phosphatase
MAVQLEVSYRFTKPLGGSLASDDLYLLDMRNGED